MANMQAREKAEFPSKLRAQFGVLPCSPILGPGPFRALGAEFVMEVPVTCLKHAIFGWSMQKSVQQLFGVAKGSFLQVWVAEFDQSGT
jgi:hypothetical protein